MSTFVPPPATAAWAHEHARQGFEVVYFRRSGDVRRDQQTPRGQDWLRVVGCTTAVEDGRTWTVDYDITLDSGWVTRRAVVTSRSEAGTRSTVLQADGAGRWRVDGAPAPYLDGCLDVDLESSAMTNALPVHRFRLPVGTLTAAPAAYVRALDLSVERLDQEYRRTADEGPRQCYDYSAPVFDFRCRLVYDESGLVLSYPGIAIRAV
ncbi:putative glycolipid-binding domain-containing protein [Streptomyces sp. NBC_00838]|uniref:putative glycolipid-binding domain-containing protein n=1 Tax=Streptomyces sp. NBC_00838 TaxID=2903680 RepID=UPI003869DE27|nr:putative glycolipid-binding domain-containing protein [Streptomyces sp. NBC_00838]